MAGGVRDRMVASAVRLLATRGVSGTSFSEVLELAQAPRGSIYHHFPEGKDQLVSGAVTLAGDRALAALEEVRGARADEVVTRYLDLWRSVLVVSNLRAGCAVLAVAVAADNPELTDQTGAVFRAWTVVLGDLLAAGGIPAAPARSWAVMLVAAAEGAVVLARAQHEVAPFEAVAGELLAGTRARMNPPVPVSRRRR